MKKQDFKDICRELLIELGISQQEFAKKIGTRQCTVSKWLNGVQEPRFFQLQNIAIAFDVDPSILLGLEYLS